MRLTVFLIAGAVLEAGGLLLVALDVHAAQGQQVTLSEPSKKLMPHASRHVLAGRRRGGPNEVSQRDLDKLVEVVASWTNRTREDLTKLRDELRPLIGEAVAGSVRRRWIGVGLFALGLLLQTVANVASLDA